MLYLNSTLNFGIPPLLLFQLEVYYKVDRLLTGIVAQQKGTTARWYSNKTSLTILYMCVICVYSMQCSNVYHFDLNASKVAVTWKLYNIRWFFHKSLTASCIIIF